MVVLLVVAGFVLSMDRFAVENLSPVTVFSVGMFLVGFSSIDELRKLNLEGVRLYGSASLIGLGLVGLMLAIVATVNVLL